MKNATLSVSAVLFLLLTLSAHRTLAAQSTIETVIYEDTVVHHLGDQDLGDWEIPSPEGTIYEATFNLGTPSNIVLALDVFNVHQDTPIMINDTQVDFLCAKGGGDEWNSCMYNIDSSFTVAGENYLTIELQYFEGLDDHYDDIMFRNLILYLCPGSAGFLDDDGDGWASCDGHFDCDDTNPSIHPSGQELCDEIDWDCSGDPYDRDFDDDGHIDGDLPCMGEDCDDLDPYTYPGAPELCDGKDNNCDGMMEADGDADGWMDCEGDCDDTDPEINPGAPETCDNGIDDDCDGLVDDDDADCSPFIIEVDASYSTTVPGMLDLDFRVGVAHRCVWVNVAITLFPSVQLIPLWMDILPVTFPAVDMELSVPFPDIGWVIIYSGLYYQGSNQAYDMEWVYTGK